MDEFAMGLVDRDQLLRPDPQPVGRGADPRRLRPGAWAVGGLPLTLDAAGSAGTDTGGSIRLPASLCGIVGLSTRPTAVVSRATA